MSDKVKNDSIFMEVKPTDNGKIMMTIKVNDTWITREISSLGNKEYSLSKLKESIDKLQTALLLLSDE